MNRVTHSIFMSAALAILLTGCQKDEGRIVTSRGERPQAGANATPIPQFSKGDPSVPDAATVFAAQDAAAKAKDLQETTALQQSAAPQKAMTKAEESKAMPLPGQANDHSTTALDKNKGK